MHLRFQISIDLLTHKIGRDIVVSEFYTLHELHLIIESSLAWDNENYYGFHIDDLSWVHCNTLEGESIESGIFLAEGTKVSEVLSLWKDEQISYRCGGRNQWELTVTIVNSHETHPDIMTATLVDANGDMPDRHTDITEQFLTEHTEDHHDARLVLKKSPTRKKIRAETSIGICAEKVTLKSAEISEARRAGTQI